MIIFDVLLLPATFFLDMCEQIKEMADDEMLLTLNSIKRKFMEVQVEYEEGKITLKEYNEATEFLSNRLEELIRISESRGVKKH